MAGCFNAEHKLSPPSKTGAIGVAVLATLLLAAASPQEKKQSAREEFDKAETVRQQLEAKPMAERTLTEYQALLRRYRNVPILAPTIHQAADSFFLSAQINEEMATRFPKDALKHKVEAKRLYQILLREYPQTKYRTQANQAIAMLDVPDADERRPARTPAPTPVSTTPPNSETRERGRPIEVSSIREWTTPSYTRVVIDLDDEVKFEAGRIANPDRIYFDLHNTHLTSGLVNHIDDVGDGLLKRVRLGVNRIGITRVVLEVGQISNYSAFLLPNPYRLVIDIQGVRTVTTAANTPAPIAPAPAADNPPQDGTVTVLPTPPLVARNQKPTAVETSAADKPVVEKTAVEKPVSDKTVFDKNEKSEEIPSTQGPTSQPVFEKVRSSPPPASTPVQLPSPASDGHRSLTRALGLKIGRIVIDAGHGGHDYGTIGPSGYAEKDLVLDVAKRLGELVQERLGSEVVYTRTDDTFVPLEMRTVIANQKQADLFISIHANASHDTRARGVETYYLSFSTSPEALDVATRENAVAEKSMHELQDLVKKITLYEKVDESREFAGDVQKSLYTGLSHGNTGLRNRGVRKAPFIVLIGANMPSILAEISFVSNPQDEKQLKKPEYRQKIAESLFHGIQQYANSLGGVKVALDRGNAPE